MEYSYAGRIVLIIIVIALIIFRRNPWKKISVYPWTTIAGKMFLVRSIMWSLALVLLILWSFNIHRISGAMPQEVTRNHVLFLLDGSLSMSADDVQPNRFRHATDIISSIVSTNSGTSYGLIVFSGLPIVRIPWTTDRAGFGSVLSGMMLGDFPPTDTFLGTALGDALLLSLDQFHRLPTQGNNAIIIISDGDSNKGYDPYKTLHLLQEQNIPVYFVAIGEEGYEVGKDAVGLPVTTSFDMQLMEQFTDQTRGKIYRNPDASELQELASLLSDQKGEPEVIYVTRTEYLNAYISPMLIIAFGILFMLNIYALIRRTKTK